MNCMEKLIDMTPNMKSLHLGELFYDDIQAQWTKVFGQTLMIYFLQSRRKKAGG